MKKPTKCKPQFQSGKLGNEIWNSLLGVWCVLKKHTEINSHASGITLIVRETEPSLLSFVTIFFQTAPGFFYCMALSFFFFFRNRNGYSHVTHCKLFCGNYGNMELVHRDNMKRSWFVWFAWLFFPKAQRKIRKRSCRGQVWSPWGDVRAGEKLKCRWEGCDFCKWRASYTSQVKIVSSRLSRIVNKQRIKVYVHEQKRASGTALCADLPHRQAGGHCRKTGKTSTWAIAIPLTRASGWV